MLKDFVHQYHHKNEIFDFQERHTIMNSELLTKISFWTVLLYMFFCLLLK